MRWTQEQWMAWMTLLGLAAALAAVYDLMPGSSSWLPSCPFHAWTGLYCPGCGSTRMLYELMHWHLLAAIQDNLLAMMTLPFCVYQLIRQLTKRSRRSRVPAWRGRAVLAAIVLFTVARNIPTEPFHGLAPRKTIATESQNRGLHETQYL